MINCFKNTLVGRTSNSQGMPQFIFCTSCSLRGAELYNIMLSLCYGLNFGQLSISVLIVLVLFRKKAANLLARLSSSMLAGKGFSLGPPVSLVISFYESLPHCLLFSLKTETLVECFDIYLYLLLSI